MQRPNVLLLHTDQQRWDALRCAGNPHIHTPNLDALAAGGVLFDNAYCNCPVCMPSRQSMLSGLYPSTVGCVCNGVEMPEDLPHLATILSPYGYHTANIGKLHFQNHSVRDHREPVRPYGFDTMILSDEPGCYDDAYIKWVEMQAPDQVESCRCSTPPARKTDVIEKHPRDGCSPYAFEGPEHLTHSAFVAEETCDFLRRRRDEPFFAIAGFYAPHSPFNPPARFLDRVDTPALPAPAMNEGDNRYGLSDDQWRAVKAHYYALVSHVDDQVGRILATLQECGLRDNTLVVFTSDHGEHLGDHGQVGKGPPGLESCAHVPLIVSWPGRIGGGQRHADLVELVDLAPTILDYAGVQTPPAFQGRSFRSLMEGADYQTRSSAFIEFRLPFGISWKTIRTPRFKYGVSNRRGEVLFDLDADPNELTNLVRESAFAPALADLRHELLRRAFDVERQYPLRTADY